LECALRRPSARQEGAYLRGGPLSGTESIIAFRKNPESVENVQPVLGPPKPPRRGTSWLVVMLVVVVGVVLAIVAAAFLLSLGNIARGPQYTMSTSNPKYAFEDSSSILHSSLGEYYLTLQVSMANTGSVSGSVSALEFRLNATQGRLYETRAMRPSSFITLAAGGSQAFTLVFVGVKMNETAYRLEFSTETTVLRAEVAPPPPPPPEFDLHIDNSTDNPYDNYGLPPGSGSVFLWVNLTITNHWHDPITTYTSAFGIELRGGAHYVAHSRLGADGISTGGTARITILWEIPATGTPNQIIFDEGFGPWGFIAF